MPAATDSLHTVLDRLADYESESASVVSVYLDLKPSQPAQTVTAFLQDAVSEHEDVAEELEKIRAYLETEKPASQGLVVFSSSHPPGLFEAVPVEAPLGGHRLYIDREPHVFPLERLADQYQSYAALLVNTNAARLYVFSAGAAERELTVKNKKGKRVSAGGWSQARYQRRAENLHIKHVKEVADAVDRLVREEKIARILVAGDAVALPLLREHLSPATQELLSEVGGLDIKTPEADVFRVTLDAFREADQQNDQEHIEALLNAWRSGGLGTVGLTGVRAALERGQVDRLLVPASPSRSIGEQPSAHADMTGPKDHVSELDEAAIEELVTLARRTDAEITFIEDARLLAPARHVGAMLRYRV